MFRTYIAGIHGHALYSNYYIIIWYYSCYQPWIYSPAVVASGAAPLHWPGPCYAVCGSSSSKLYMEAPTAQSLEKNQKHNLVNSWQRTTGGLLWYMPLYLHYSTAPPVIQPWLSTWRFWASTCFWWKQLSRGAFRENTPHAAKGYIGCIVLPILKRPRVTWGWQCLHDV